MRKHFKQVTRKLTSYMLILSMLASAVPVDLVSATEKDMQVTQEVAEETADVTEEMSEIVTEAEVTTETVTEAATEEVTTESTTEAVVQVTEEEAILKEGSVITC